MKKTLLLLAAFGVMNAFPAPKYLVFSGRLNFIPSDVGGYAAANGIRVGNTVTYVMVVDTARQAYTTFNGVKSLKPDTLNEGTGYRADYFFDSLDAGSLFAGAVTDLASGSNLGYHTATKLGANFRYSAQLQVTLGNPDHYTQIQVTLPDQGELFAYPALGTAVTAGESYVGPSGAFSTASMTMTLVGIGDTRPIIGIRNFGRAERNWMRADFQGGSLVLRNGTGRTVAASILNVEGETLHTMSLGAIASLSASSLPRGMFLVKVADPGHGAPVVQAFAR